ncbi:hypothetical protein WMY93_033255, partial [Mugilogobius chulae]
AANLEFNLQRLSLLKPHERLKPLNILVRRLGVDAEDGAGVLAAVPSATRKSEPNPGEEILGSSAAAAGCDSQ